MCGGCTDLKRALLFMGLHGQHYFVKRKLPIHANEFLAYHSVNQVILQ